MKNVDIHDIRVARRLVANALTVVEHPLLRYELAVACLDVLQKFKNEHMVDFSVDDLLKVRNDAHEQLPF